ncbi:rab-type ras small GTPase, partial [Eremomyces bilateralis CBS 781.70]
QELGSMYDYLAKIILLGPSGCGKSCLLHRFVKDEWRVLSSHTIGVEFSSKIVKVGTGARRKRIKLQLWDTAGTERFRSVSRSYYRGAAGAILVYDIASRASFSALPTFLHDARALSSPQLTVILAGNKADLSEPTSSHGGPPSEENLIDMPSTPTASSYDSRRSAAWSTMTPTATQAPEGREVRVEETARWAAENGVPVAVEVSALTGEAVEELFTRLGRMILTKIELGEIDPADPSQGIQYGDWGDTGSVRSGMTVEDAGMRRRGRRRGEGTGRWREGMREWEEVFRLDSGRRGAGGGGGGGGCNC